jgi:hypothetical protein
MRPGPWVTVYIASTAPQEDGIAGFAWLALLNGYKSKLALYLEQAEPIFLGQIWGVNSMSSVSHSKSSSGRRSQSVDFEKFKNDLQSRWEEYARRRISFKLVDDIRRRFNLKYPDVNEPPEDEHPMAAVGIVLLSAVILGTTDIVRLVEFTGYSSAFISAIARNMEHNKLLEGGRYKEDHRLRWISADGIITNDNEFWDHIEIACGEMWQPGIDTDFALDPCKIYSDEQQEGVQD